MVFQEKKSCAGFGKPLMTDFIQLEATPLENTTIFPTLTANKNINNSEEFIMKLKTENIGNKTAYNCIAELKTSTEENEEFPNDWIIAENPISIGNIGVGEIKNIFFELTRGEVDETIYAVVSCDNIIPTSTEQIPIPIYLITMIILVISILGILLVNHKRQVSLYS